MDNVIWNAWPLVIWVLGFIAININFGAQANPNDPEDGRSSKLVYDSKLDRIRTNIVTTIGGWPSR